MKPLAPSVLILNTPHRIQKNGQKGKIFLTEGRCEAYKRFTELDRPLSNVSPFPPKKKVSPGVLAGHLRKKPDSVVARIQRSVQCTAPVDTQRFATLCKIQSCKSACCARNAMNTERFRNFNHHCFGSHRSPVFHAVLKHSPCEDPCPPAEVR